MHLNRRSRDGSAVGILGDLLEEFQFVSSNVDLTDQSIRKLLDFGKAMDADNKRTRMRDTVAFMMGSVGNNWASQGYVNGRMLVDDGREDVVEG